VGTKKEMKREFIIPFVGLNPGEHHYEFTIGNTFFEDLEYSEIRKGNVEVKLTLNRQSTMMIFSFELKGTVAVACDRCGDDFDQPIASTQQLIVKLNADNFEDNDEIISLAAGEYEFDISHYIYEYIILSLPARRIHGETEGDETFCDPEVIKMLDEVSPGEAGREEGEIDPRWAALKALQKKKK
jgi:uncharacterized protein